MPLPSLNTICIAKGSSWALRRSFSCMWPPYQTHSSRPYRLRFAWLGPAPLGCHNGVVGSTNARTFRFPEDEFEYPSGEKRLPPDEWTVERMMRANYL